MHTDAWGATLHIGSRALHSPIPTETCVPEPRLEPQKPACQPKTEPSGMCTDACVNEGAHLTAAVVPCSGQVPVILLFSSLGLNP